MNLACCPIFLGLSRSTTMETLRSQDSSCEHKHKWQQQQLHGADGRTDVGKTRKIKRRRRDYQARAVDERSDRTHNIVNRQMEHQV